MPEGQTYKDTMIAQINEKEDELLKLIDTFAQNSEAGMIQGRHYAIGKTQIEMGFEMLRRSIRQHR